MLVKTQLSIFNFNNQGIRVIIIDNEPWFIAADVCAVLEHTNTSVALSRLPYQRHIASARAEVFRKERPHQFGIFDNVTVITAKGQLYIAKKLRQLERAELVESQLEAVIELVE